MPPFLRLFTLFLLGTLSLSAETSPADSILRINATLQSYHPFYPWQKNNPRKRSGLGTLLPNNQVLTAAKLVADAVYLEFESADKAHTVTARVAAIDYEANLALLTPADPDKLGFLKDLPAAQLAEKVLPGDSITILQLDDTGTAQRTVGPVRSLSLESSFLDNRLVLTARIKASLQSENSSFTIPAFKENGRFAGVLTSYSSNDQISDVTTPDVIRLFLEDAADGQYVGFPSLGIGFATTEDRNFRRWLELPASDGGLFIDRLAPGGAAEVAGVKKGDVLLAIDGHQIDRRGYFDHPEYGRLYWTHLISSNRKVGDQPKLQLLRDGEKMELTVTLTRRQEPLVTTHFHGSAPPFLLEGGLIFQELSMPYLKAFGKKWSERAPSNLLDILYTQHEFQKKQRKAVILTRIIASEATIGYEQIHNHLVKEVNGHPVTDIPSLAAAFEKKPENGIHVIVTDKEPYKIYLDASQARATNQQFLDAGLPALSRY